MDRLKRILGKVDRFQQSRPWLAFPVAVVKKFGDDRGGNLAALLAYYGFFSVFPLLLVFVSVLGFVLEGDADFRREVLDSSLASFPVIGDEIRRNVGNLEGSGLGLGIGLGAAIWAGLGIVRTLQFAMNRVWAVPQADRASYLTRVGRALLFLLILGGGVVASTGASSLASSLDLGWASRAGGFASGFLLSLLVFVFAFRLLTSADVTVRDVLPGALCAAVFATLLQLFGSMIVRDRIANASSTYGTFALVIGLLTWMYIGAQLTVLSAEVNAVKKKQLWPRSFEGGVTDADHRAFELYMERERRADPRDRDD